VQCDRKDEIICKSGIWALMMTRYRIRGIMISKDVSVRGAYQLLRAGRVPGKEESI
jgi:hypothetical protein